MEWPIDTSAFSFMGSLPPDPVLDLQTKEQKTGANGEPLYSMELMCFSEEGAALLTVSFPGTPPVGLKPNTVTLRWHVRSRTLFARSRPSDNANLVSRSESHAAWLPLGLKGDVLANAFDSGEAQKILWLFDRA